MDTDDNDAQDQNLHIVGEESSKVSPVLQSFSLPKFEFDDSLQGHLRFDNLVNNEVFLQEDNNWIEEYSTASKSTRKNVWSEATSSESVEMLLKSVGQEEKVLEESNRHSSLTNVMDPKGELESVVLGDSKIATESVVNELQVDSSVSKVECGNAGSSQNVENASGNNDSDYIDKSKENSVDNSTNSDTVAEGGVLNVESVGKPLVESGVSVNEETENGVSSDAQHVTSAEIPSEDVLNKDGASGNTDVNVVGAADSPKNDEGVNAIVHAESNMDVLTDAVVAVESSKLSSPDTTDGVQLPSGTVATSDVVTDDQPRSPILGVSLLSDDNKEKVEVGSTSEGAFQKQSPEVEKGTVSDGAEKIVHVNAGQSEQTGDDESGSLPDPKESMTGEDGAEPLNLAVNMPDQQQVSVDIDSPSGCDTNPSSLDKPQTSLSDTKSVELSQTAKDKHDVTKGAKEDKNFTFEVNASSSQNINFSTNTVSSVSSHGSQLDPNKLHEDSPVTQSPITTSAATRAKGTSERKPRKKSVGTETAKQSNNLKEKTPARRSRKTEKSPPLQTPPTTGHVTPVSNPKPGGMTPISTSTLPILNNSTSVFHHSFTDNQQVQLRAQILVYGSILSGVPPEEPHMIAAFGQSDGGRRAWEATWHAYLERVRGPKAQPNNPGPSTPNQAVKIGSAQSKILSGISSPIVNPIIPISSPLWNIPTPSDGSQSNAMPKSDLFGPFQNPVVQNFAGHNPMWPSQGVFPGQWVASSPVASFNARLSALPITESVKLTTVKESGAVSMPVISVGPSASPTVSPMLSSGQTSGQTSSDPKSRKRKKVVNSNITTSAALSTPVGNFVPPISFASTHGQPSNVTHVDQNMEKIVTRENTVSKIEESKVQAADAAVHAAAAVNHFENVWKQLESRKNSGLVSDDEAKLASSAVSIAAASSVAKVAAAAAKIASDVAEQARLMADEVFLSNKTDSYNQSGTTSIISAAKEAARRRIEAASAASKHAENLDAIVKAAELAAEAVSQAGKIVAIGNPLSIRELVEAGPEGYWKFPESSVQTGRSDKQNVETALNDKEDLVKDQMIVASNEKGRNGPNLSKTAGSVHTSDVDPNMLQSTSSTWKDNIIKEGCLVEVRKDDDKKKSAWFAANVSTLKDGKAFVCYTELQSNDGSGKLTEWVALEGEGTEPPRIRIAHPMTTMRSEGTRKRGRTTLTDYGWCSGDRVDVWVQDCWCEAVVVETNKTDLTSLTVQFPAQGETSVVRSWHVRPTLIWKDGKWIEWSSLKVSHSSEGDTPREKRHKIGSSPVIEGKDKAKPSNNANLVESGRRQESRNIPISSIGISIDLGKSARSENKFDTLKTVNSGTQKKQSRVVFGVPKPGKTQKFMDVSTHRVDDRNNKSNTPSDSVKLVNYLMPQASGARGSKNNSKTEAKEKQVAEVKPKVIKTRKPPVPSVKTLTQKDKSKGSKPTSHDAFTSDENLSGQPNRMDVDSSNTEDAKETSTSKATKVEFEDKSTSEIEPRRSVRRIQPTSRLLEGLQSSLTVSHPSPRSHKVTSKGSSN
ncbi:putative transcription factor interactor and regulator C3H-WRC/GRF family [Helianthus annuus]|nr:putative transcription factor interactor and regulator C3H-WRC/GRF family [Helianthus annuus]